jgi:hypothetical protein
LGSNVVSELLGLFEPDAGVIGVFLRCLDLGHGDGLSEPGEVGSVWAGLDARPPFSEVLEQSPSRWMKL